MENDILGLQWVDHSQIFGHAIGSLRGKSLYTDATLACEGKFYPVHKFILSTCSDYFSAIFEWTPCVNPVIVINNVPSRDLEFLLDFMYTGEANIREAHIKSVMKVAEGLKIRGLSVLDERLSESVKATAKPVSRKRKRPEPKKVCQQSKRVNTSSLVDATLPVHSPSKNIPHHVSSPLLQSAVVSPINSSHIDESPGSSHHFHGHAEVLSDTSIKSETQSQLSGRLSVNAVVDQEMPKESAASSKEVNGNFSVDSNREMTERTIPVSEIPSATILHIPEHLPLPESQQMVHLKSNNTSSLSSVNSEHKEVVLPLESGEVMSALTAMEYKIMRDVQLNNENGKELDLPTEDESVCMPELLDSFVDMRPIYEPKSNHAEEIESVQSDCKSQMSTSALKRDRDSSPVAVHDSSEGPSGLCLSADDSHKEKPGGYRCHHCEVVCQKKDSLARHMHKHSDFPYRCTVCPFKCKTYKELIDHRRIHATKCCPFDGCSFMTMRNDNLKRHVKNHSVERQHKCPHCSFSSKTIHNLKSHILNHHKKESDFI